MVFVLIGIGAAALWRAVPRGDGAAAAVAGRTAGSWAPRPPRPPRPPRRSRQGASSRSPACLRSSRGPRPMCLRPCIVMAAFRRPLSRRSGSRRPPGPGPIQLRAIPDFKSVESYAYPLVSGGRSLDRGERVSEAMLGPRGTAATQGESLVVICNSLFEAVTGAPCGGPGRGSARAPGRGRTDRSLRGGTGPCDLDLSAGGTVASTAPSGSARDHGPLVHDTAAARPRHGRARKARDHGPLGHDNPWPASARLASGDR